VSSVIFDIETGPLDREVIAARSKPFPAFEPPAPFDPEKVKYGNTTDEGKRNAKLDAEREKHAKSREQADLDYVIACDEYFDNLCKKAALSALTGQVLAVGYRTVAGTDSTIMCDVGTENEILSAFWVKYSASKSQNDRMIGFNSNYFDVPYLIQRSWINNVPIPGGVFDGRYLSRNFVDLMDHWSCGVRGNKVKLDFVANALGIEGKTGSGADFADLLIEDREAALNYLRNDIRVTWEVALRMGVI
jgi:hypothetical protein